MTRGMSRPADGRAARSAGASEHGRCGVCARCPSPSRTAPQSPPAAARCCGPGGSAPGPIPRPSRCVRDFLGQEMAFEVSEVPAVPPRAGWKTIPRQSGRARCFSKQQRLVFLAKAAVGHFTASKIPRPILPSGILAEQGSFPHRFPAALRTALPSPLPEQLSSWDGSPAPRPARCQRTVLRLIFPEPLGPALCLLAGGPTAAGDGRVAHVGAPGSVCCRAPVGGGGGGGGSRGAAGWRRRGRVPQQSAAISREREGCVCFCNPPPFFLIVILAVVKGAGLTRHGDGKASGLR